MDKDKCKSCEYSCGCVESCKLKSSECYAHQISESKRNSK